jgi:stearoyl-CoA desaturase (delta-9 desaturase)
VVSSNSATVASTRPDKTNWAGSIPFFLVHLACGLVFVTGFSWKWALIALATYYVRMMGVTIGYHRYFSHRAFQTNRVFQFVLAFWASSSAQKGVLWWAAHHRHHHKESDQPDDIHSPLQRGFWYSHVGWILSSKYDETEFNSIKDFARFPELRLINKYHWVPMVIYAAATLAIGGFPGFVWAFIVSTTLLWHGTFTINSLSHVFGQRRYLTTDTSRNNVLLALITCGEGWHNNHHYYQNTANQGWFWWEVDLSFYALKVFSWVGLVSKLRLPAEQTRMAFTQYTDAEKARLRTKSQPEMAIPVGLPAVQPLPAK